jgi:hypothetical protein
VHAGGAGLDHRAHQLVGIQHAAEAGLRVGHDGREVIDVSLAFHPLDLVGAGERVVDSSHHGRNRGHCVERLVGVHLQRIVRVRRDLPAGEIDRRHARLHLLHRLVAGKRAERIHERQLLSALPQLFCAALRERVLDAQAAAHRTTSSAE